MEAINKILRTPSAFVLLLAAIISLIGIIIKSKSDEAIARIPIDATSTAEARLTEYANLVNQTSTLPPTEMPTLITQPSTTTPPVIYITATGLFDISALLNKNYLKDSEIFPAYPEFPISYRHLSVGYGEIYIGTAVRFAARANNYSTMELSENIPYTIFVVKGPPSSNSGSQTEVDLEIDNGGWDHYINVYDDDFLSNLIAIKIEEVKKHSNYDKVGHTLVIIQP